MEWISVEKELPESIFDCLVVVDDINSGKENNYLGILNRFVAFDGEFWLDDDGLQLPFEVRYWLKVPDFPKE